MSARSEPAEVPLGLNLLLLGLDLDLLLGDGDLLGGRELLQLLLLMDELVVLVGAGLGGHGVEDGGDGLALDDGLGDGSGRGDELSLKIQCECHLNLGTCPILLPMSQLLYIIQLIQLAI